MSQNTLLVSIGIPTYNRCTLLKRSIESVLNQTYRNIEIIISDNASTDQTMVICQDYFSYDNRVKYFRQSTNLGPTNNFIEVLKMSHGEYFMWLGDDDWIDENYVSSCVKEMNLNPSISLVSGTVQYYLNEQKQTMGNIINLTQNSPWHRVIIYYTRVRDNGMFYGIMRKKQIEQVEIKEIMGGDWLIIASIVFMGKAKILNETSVHRELGGTSSSNKEIAEMLNLSFFHSAFSGLSIGINAFKDILYKNKVYKDQNIFIRIFYAVRVFYAILSRKQINLKTFFHKLKAHLIN